jgi:YD repeat-containing protein
VYLFAVSEVMDPKTTCMKTNILRRLLFNLAMVLIIVSCSEEEDSTTCVLQKFSIVSPDNHWLLEFNDNGTIASATSIFGGVENQRYDYSYASDKISIYLTDLLVSNQLACVIGLDAKGRPVSRTENGTLYERLIYNGDRLDHAMWQTNDSLVYRYTGGSKNPDAVDIYGYNESNQTWTHFSTTTLTYDEKPNPMKGLILPTTDWNVNGFLRENNLTSYSTDTESWYLTYTYNNEGYPVSRTLTSPSYNVSETIDFEYNCH